MKTEIIATAEFEGTWPFVVDHMSRLLGPVTEVNVARLPLGVRGSISEATSDQPRVERLIALGATVTDSDLDALPSLREIVVSLGYRGPEGLDELLAGRNIRHVEHHSEGFWGQSVAEFALGLTIAALRRIPQRHHALIARHDAWDYEARQYSDDSRFTNGTVEGKRVRIIGAGNIASRYAAFVHTLGADVAAWDPYATEPSFHRSGARRCQFLDQLIEDADIFVPMVPLTPGTEGLVTDTLIRALPKGCLVVQATRAKVVDTTELRRRVLAEDLSLAADVFDMEPLTQDDPLLGRENVVHTPHIAGRTKDANYRWAEALVEQFAEYDRRLAPNSAHSASGNRDRTRTGSRPVQ